MRTLSLFIGISSIVLSPLFGSTAHAGITTKTELYAVRGERKLELHLHYPEGWKAEDERPSIIFFFGGGWSGGSPKKFVRQAEYFASRGMVAARADYRVKSRDGVTPDDCVRDARSAVRWMKKNSDKLGIDPNKIVASGGSAGGHLAACMMIENSVDANDDDLTFNTMPIAMILFNPVMTFEHPKLSRRLKEKGELARKISPNAHLNKSTPPSLILFGSKDRLISLANPYWEKAEKLGVRAERFIAEGERHGFFNKSPWFERTLIAADKFLASLGLLEGAPTLKEPIVEQSPGGDVQKAAQESENIKGYTGLYMGHSFFMPCVQHLEKVVPGTHIVGHTQYAVIGGGRNGSAKELWTNPERSRKAKQHLDTGKVDLLVMTYFSPGDSAIEHYRKWFDYAISKNPNVTFMLTIPWGKGLHKASKEQLNQKKRNSSQGVHDSLVAPLRKKYPKNKVLFCPYGLGTYELIDRFNDGKLPGVKYLLDTDKKRRVKNRPKQESLLKDEISHPNGLIARVGSLLWLQTLYDYDLSTLKDLNIRQLPNINVKDIADKVSEQIKPFNAVYKDK